MCSSRGGAEIELRFPDSEAGSTFCSVSSHASVVLCSEQCTRMDLVAVQASQHTCAQCWAPEPTTHPCRDQGRIVPDCPHGLKLQINMTQRGCLCLRISVQVASAEGRRQHRGHLHRTQSGGVRGHRDDCVKFCSEASAKDGVGGLEVQLKSCTVTWGGGWLAVSGVCAHRIGPGASGRMASFPLAAVALLAVLCSWQ